MIVPVFAATIAMIVLAVRSPRGLLSAPVAFGAVLYVFHFGVVVAVALEGSGWSAISAVGRAWLVDDATIARALVASAIGIVTYTAGCMTTWNGRTLRPLGRWTVDRGRLSVIGGLLAVISIGFVVSQLVGFAGLDAVVGPYSNYLALPGRSSLSLALLLLSLSIVFVAASAWTRWHRWSVPLLITFGAIAFLLGLRGEILFPATAAVVIAARRRPTTSQFRLAVIGAMAILMLLSAISLGRTVRQTGIADAALAFDTAKPADALTELGSTLRPVVETIRWEEAGDEPALGATYWAPIDRALRSVLGTSTPVERRRTRHERGCRCRVGNIGYSSIAEAYRNFGLLGVLLVHFGLGLLIGSMSRWEADPFRLALMGVVLVPLLNHVRNSFVPVPLQIVLGALTTHDRLKAIPPNAGRAPIIQADGAEHRPDGFAFGQSRKLANTHRARRDSP